MQNGQDREDVDAFHGEMGFPTATGEGELFQGQPGVLQAVARSAWVLPL